MRLIFKSQNFFGLELRKAVPRRFLNRQKSREKIFTPEDKIIQYSPWQALQLIRLHAFTSFTETIDVCIKLGVNPKHGEQIVRGSAFMPAGLGRETRVAVLCDNDSKQQLQGKGVDVFVDADVLNNIQKSIFDFDMLFTTPEMLGSLKAFGKVLGPKGLMPNAKTGTLVKKIDLQKAVERAKAGQVNYRVDSGRNLHAHIGKITFKDDQLLRNFKSLMQSLVEKKPTGIKGRYFQEAYIKSTMGPRWKLKIEEIDPRNLKTVWDLVN